MVESRSSATFGTALANIGTALAGSIVAAIKRLLRQDLAAGQFDPVISRDQRGGYRGHHGIGRDRILAEAR
jgi:hypothetical protein